MNNVAQSNQSVRRTIDDATKKFFASHDNLTKEIKDEFLRFTGVLVVQLEALMKRDQERDMKTQAIFEMTERIHDLVLARLSYPVPREGDYLEAIDDWRSPQSYKEGNQSTSENKKKAVQKLSRWSQIDGSWNCCSKKFNDGNFSGSAN